MERLAVGDDAIVRVGDGDGDVAGDEDGEGDDTGVKLGDEGEGDAITAGGEVFECDRVVKVGEIRFGVGDEASGGELAPGERVETRMEARPESGDSRSCEMDPLEPSYFMDAREGLGDSESDR